MRRACSSGHLQEPITASCDKKGQLLMSAGSRELSVRQDGGRSNETLSSLSSQPHLGGGGRKREEGPTPFPPTVGCQPAAGPSRVRGEGFNPSQAGNFDFVT